MTTCSFSRGWVQTRSGAWRAGRRCARRPRQPTPDRHPRRLYNWDPALHGGAAGLAFLDSAAAAGLRVMLPISNYFLEHREAARAIVQRIARHPAILLWAVSNEPDAGSHLSLACIPLRASLRAPRHARTGKPAGSAEAKAAFARVASLTRVVREAEDALGTWHPITVPLTCETRHLAALAAAGAPWGMGGFDGNIDGGTISSHVMQHDAGALWDVDGFNCYWGFSKPDPADFFYARHAASTAAARAASAASPLHAASRARGRAGGGAGGNLSLGTSRPLLLTEWGSDSYDNIAGASSEAAQPLPGTLPRPPMWSHPPPPAPADPPPPGPRPPPPSDPPAHIHHTATDLTLKALYLLTCAAWSTAQDEQAELLVAQWRRLISAEGSAAAVAPGGAAALGGAGMPQGAGTVGGVVFEWADEPWKAAGRTNNLGSPCSPARPGVLAGWGPNALPDACANEARCSRRRHDARPGSCSRKRCSREREVAGSEREGLPDSLARGQAFFGLTETVSGRGSGRRLKRAYWALRAEWTSLAPPADEAARGPAAAALSLGSPAAAVAARAAALAGAPLRCGGGSHGGELGGAGLWVGVVLLGAVLGMGLGLRAAAALASDTSRRAPVLTTRSQARKKTELVALVPAPAVVDGIEDVPGGPSAARCVGAAAERARPARHARHKRDP